MLDEDLRELAKDISNYAAIKVGRNNFKFESNTECGDCGTVSNDRSSQRFHFLTHNDALLMRIMNSIKKNSVSHGSQWHSCKICYKEITGSVFKLKYHFVFAHLVSAKNFDPYV